MTPPINSVSHERLAEMLTAFKDSQPHEHVASADEVRAIATELAARRAANTPVDGAETLEVAGWTDKLLTELAAKDPWDYADQTQARGLLMSFKGILAAALSASPAMPSQLVGVTELVWVKRIEGSYTADTAFGHYRVDEAFQTPTASGMAVVLPTWWGPMSAAGQQCVDLAAAKAAAQADFNARIQSCITSPAAEPVGWETEAEWDLETRVFNAANNRDVPEWARKVVADVWKQYCLAANPAPSASREVTVTDEMVERAAQELLAHGEFSSIPWRNHDNALKAARAALLAALPERDV